MSESKNLLKSILNSAKSMFFSTTAKAAPEVMANAAILDGEEKLRDISKLVAQYRQELKRENSEAELAQQEHDKNINRARNLKRKIEEESDEIKKAELSCLMQEVMLRVEKSASRLEKEKSDVVKAENNLKKVEMALESVTQNVRSVKEAANTIKNRIKTAQAEGERIKAEQELEQVLSEISGAGSNGSALSSSLNALKKVADDIEVENESLSITSSSLKSASGDTDIDKKLAQLDGDGDSGQSLEDKMKKFNI